MDHCLECDFTYDEDDAPAAARTVRDGVAEVAAILRAHRIGDLRTRPRPGVWSPLEYGCHVRDVLLVQRERVLTARRTARPVCAPMGRDERVEHDGYAEQDPGDVARQLLDAARLFGTVLDRLGPDWERTLLYPYPSSEPRERSLRWVAVHTVHEVRHHLLDIRRQVS
ncbi:DinB family protein [Amycolatopsis magusensis]|uniref:Plasmid stabilization system protein ParE n=1 Tax=Amycolatopsis magusensis TaxID=882444 RepID=A0ABS4Q1D6_9PSEU|nr:DinB family protein [Amycolatopsis magusensis]MBP2185489.1 plasmid stabilization system protein ParE [Amycolatopsis magusensis]